MSKNYYQMLKDGILVDGSGGGDAPAPVLITKNVTANGTYAASDDSADGYSAVTVNVPTGGGGGSVTKKAVNFYDYDGTVVYSYTAAEFAALTAMPDNPSHDGLTAQGWNWSLADAKTYVASYGKLNIGQMYITSDGKTRLYIELTEGRLSPYLKLYLNANSELDIDWGDGSAHSTLTSATADYKSEQHTYATAGSYVIAITVVIGRFSVQSSLSSLSTLLTNNNTSTSSPDRGYLNSIKKIEIGNGIASIESCAFYYCTSLNSITIPKSVTSIGGNAFQNCSSLNTITIPDAVTSIGDNAFYSCFSLISIAISDAVTSIGSKAFQSCFSLISIAISDAVTYIGSNAFQSCYSLSTITIPDSVTSIGSSAFQNCYSLSTITIDKPEDSITGSPWGANTSSPTYTQIIWAG